MSSRGIQLSGGMGREMANLITENTTKIDMFNYDLTRFQEAYVRNDQWRRETVHEGEVITYWPKPPTLQRLGGRNMRQSPLHDRYGTTVWKFSNFPATLILREINFGLLQKAKNC